MILPNLVFKGIFTSFLALTIATPQPSFIENVALEAPSIERDAFSGYHTLKVICSCESGLTHFDKNGDVLKGTINRFDIGICQINELYHQEKVDELGLDIYTEEGNIAYAKHLYDTQGDAPWIWSKPCWEKKLANK